MLASLLCGPIDNKLYRCHLLSASNANSSQAVQLASAGFRSIHGRAASICAAKRNTIASSPYRATSWIATGNPRGAPAVST